jgi:hypothetical protein
MKKQCLLGCIVIFFFTSWVNGQVNFRPGFIITNNQDTVYGQIDYRSDIRMSEVCTFRTKQKEKIIYSPDEIFGFKFESGRFFISNEVYGKLRFVEILVEGELSIYYYDDNTKPRYFFKTDIKGKLIELKYFERTVTINEHGMSSDGKNYRVVDHKVSKGYGKPGEYSIKSQEFKDILHDSLKVDGELSNFINKMEKPNHSDLIDLAKYYHKLISSNEESIVYADLNKKSFYELSIGWININYRDFWTNETYLIYSLKGNLPLANRKIFLGYGIQYAPVNFEYYSRKYSYKLFRLPLSIRYQYPGNYFKPNVALGLNIYAVKNSEKMEFIQDFVPSYMIGVAIKVYKNIHLSISVEGDLLWNSYYNSSEKATFSQTNNIGLMINL